jgi:hypothetical protein
MRQVQELQVSTIRRRELSVATRPDPDYWFPWNAELCDRVWVEAQGPSHHEVGEDGVKPLAMSYVSMLIAAAFWRIRRMRGCLHPALGRRKRTLPLK